MMMMTSRIVDRYTTIGISRRSRDHGVDCTPSTYHRAFGAVASAAHCRILCHPLPHAAVQFASRQRCLSSLTVRIPMMDNRSQAGRTDGWTEGQHASLAHSETGGRMPATVTEGQSRMAGRLKSASRVQRPQPIEDHRVNCRPETRRRRSLVVVQRAIMAARGRNTFAVSTPPLIAGKGYIESYRLYGGRGSS